MTARRFDASGPFRASQLRSGDPYELSRGHAIECLPAGPRHGRPQLIGGAALLSDPAVNEAGVEVGYSPQEDMLRAPDVAVGNVPDTAGWVPGVPPLAVEYAEAGQNEAQLQEKIADLLGAGTKYLWVVRLVGTKRVEVYEPGQPMRKVSAGEELEAPGVLQNPLPVEALYEPEASRRIMLRNLLQRSGYGDLQHVRDEGKKLGLDEGKKLGLQQTIFDLCEAYGTEVTAERRAHVQQLDLPELAQLRVTLKTTKAFPPVPKKSG